MKKHERSSTEPLGLVVTGSRLGRYDVALALDAWVAKHGTPRLVIVGDQRGVDTQALEWVQKRGFDWAIERVRDGMDSPECFHDRNQRMVDHAQAGDHLLAFPMRGSKGTWDCFRRGVVAGLVCAEVTTWWFQKYTPEPKKELA